MKSETLAYVLENLNTQYAHINEQAQRSRAAAERQRTYYCGLLNAANMIISDGYQNDLVIVVDADGNHAVRISRV